MHHSANECQFDFAQCSRTLVIPVITKQIRKASLQCRFSLKKMVNITL